MSIPPIIYESCGEKGHRYDLRQPFSWGENLEWIYATDGRILTRCPRNGEVMTAGWNREDGFKVPNPDQIVDQQDGERITVYVPDCDQWKPCGYCQGSGLITTGDCCCEECGAITPILLKGQPLAYDCPNCAGKGSQPNDEAIRVSVGPPIFFQARYLAILRRNGVEQIHISTDDKKAATFHGDGFEGWLMPMDTELALQDERRKAMT